MTLSLALKRFGLTSILAECSDLSSALAVHSHLQRNPPKGLIELIPAAQTVLVRFEQARYASEFARTFRGEGISGGAQTQQSERIIDVIYDGEDLGEVAQHTGLTVEQVINAHTQQTWSVAFAGFAPGFFYLHAEENVLEVPRRASPRTAVPSGAVGLAGQFSGIYPRTSPGGWQLIGRTDAPLWDLSQNPPALLEPGNTVRFRAVREHIDIATPESTVSEPTTDSVLTVKTAGAQLLFEDEGRSGLTHWGVSPSGFADPVAAHAANLLVGNKPSATVLESLMGGFVLEAKQDAVIALTGARALAIVTEDDQPDRVVPLDTPVALLTGQTLRVGVAEEGLRVYVGIRGGFATQLAAKSYSTDTMSAIGPASLKTGDCLFVGEVSEAAVAHPIVAPQLPDNQDGALIRVILGPREDWFTKDSVERFFATEWSVTSESNRIGVRLAPAQPAEQPAHTKILERSHTEELPSEGMISGAIQVPPNGEPVVFLADHPVTGGYPVIASVHPDDLRLLAQSQPGTTIRFTRFEVETEANEQENTRA